MTAHTAVKNRHFFLVAKAFSLYYHAWNSYHQRTHGKLENSLSFPNLPSMCNVWVLWSGIRWFTDNTFFFLLEDTWQTRVFKKVTPLCVEPVTLRADIWNENACFSLGVKSICATSAALWCNLFSYSLTPLVLVWLAHEWRCGTKEYGRFCSSHGWNSALERRSRVRGLVIGPFSQVAFLLSCVVSSEFEQLVPAHKVHTYTRDRRGSYTIHLRFVGRLPFSIQVPA